MTKLENGITLLDIQQARNEFDWINYLLDIKYMVDNQIELIGEPD